MARGAYTPDPSLQYSDDDGRPLAGGSLASYVAGTSTPLSTYADVGLTVPNPDALQLDASGRPPSGGIFLTPGLSYKYVLNNAVGATIATRDNVNAVPLSTQDTGTWVPAVQGSIGPTDIIYFNQAGTYTKMGQFVQLTGFISIDTINILAGNLSIVGIPFASKGYPCIGAVTFSTRTVWTNIILFDKGGLGFNLWGTTGVSTGMISLTGPDIQGGISGVGFVFTVSYLTF